MHKDKNIDTIIWDLGGVLIDWNPDYVFQHIYPDVEERKWFFDNVCTHEWNLQQDAGRSLQVATDEKVTEWPDHEEQIRAFYGRWEEMLGGPIEESVELLRALKAKNQQRLFALTNWSHETFPVALKRYDFLQWFHGIVVSGVEKVIKPQREIFELLLNRYDIDPARAVFIDDNAGNVSGAKTLGMHGIHFSSPSQLAHKLRTMGLDIDIK
jgi:2-haloacid dehalogenase